MKVEEYYIRNLLAVIHRDDGRHTEEFGLVQSIRDAQHVITRLRIAAELNKPKREIKGSRGKLTHD
jgi:hypothetical protein